MKQKIIFLFSTVFISIIYCSFSIIFLPQVTKSFYDFKILAILLFVVLTIYFILYLNRDSWLKFINKKYIIISSIVFCIILCLQTVYFSSDVYYYLFHARIATHHQQNPYLVAPINFQSDLFYASIQNSDWNELTNNYGPLWFYFTLIPDALGLNNLALTLMMIKILLSIIFIFTGLIIYKTVKIKYPDHAKTALFLFLWNPLLIFEVASNAHNDTLLLFFIVFALYFFTTKKYLLTAILLLLSVLTKYITLPILLLYLFYLLIKKIHNKKIIFLKIIACFLTIIFLSYLPILKNLEIFKGVVIQAQLFDIYNSSPFIAILFMIYKVNHFDNALAFAKTISLSFFVLFSAALIIYYLYKKKYTTDFLYLCLLILNFMLFFMFSWYKPWYVLWLFPFALITKKYQHVFYATLIGICSYFTPIFTNYLIVLIMIIIWHSFMKIKSIKKMCY